jgi:hypothetical protein
LFRSEGRETVVLSADDADDADFLGVLFCRAAAEALKAQKLWQPKGWTTYGNIRQQNIFSFIACFFFFSV